MTHRSNLTRRSLLVGSSLLLPAALLRCKTSGPEPLVVKASATREVARIVAARKTTEGAGVRLNRTLGGPELASLDPFLLLDEIRSDRPDDYAAGFPSHPHRGFETVTYMIDGAMDHKDSVGNHGHLAGGAAQWMTAGRGIVHSEMPQQDRGLLWGFQLWVNLPKAHKMMKPRYQDIAPTSIPEIAGERSRTRVVAGAYGGSTGPVGNIDVEPLFLDVALTSKGSFAHAIPKKHTAFVYVMDGAIRLGEKQSEVRERELAILTEGDALIATCDAERGRFLLLAARPLNEPIARHGPFVMNTDDEIREAIADYRSGRLTEG